MNVTMVNSVDEYVAGEDYELDDELSDRFVILGYATGDLSREYTDEERANIRNQVQEIGA